MPPSGELVLTTWPGVSCAIMRGRKAWTPWKTPQTLTAKAHCQSLRSCCHIGPSAPEPTPALLQSTSTLGKVAKARSASAWTDSGRETSVTWPIASASPARCRMTASTAFASAGSSTSARTTFMPSAANSFAIASPMPPAAPVTTAVLPGRSVSIRYLHGVVDLRGVVVALVDVGQDRPRIEPGHHLTALIGGLLAEGDLDQAADRQVGDRVEVRVAEHDFAVDRVQDAGLLGAEAADQQRIGVEAVPVDGGQELQVPVGLHVGRRRFEQPGDPAVDLDERDAVPGDPRGDLVAVLLERDLGQLLRLAEHLAAADQRALGGHRYHQGVPALFGAVRAGGGDRGGAERRAEDVDLIDGGADVRLGGGLQRRRQDLGEGVRVGLPDGVHAGGPQVGQLGGGGAGLGDGLRVARAVTDLWHI